MWVAREKRPALPRQFHLNLLSRMLITLQRPSQDPVLLPHPVSLNMANRQILIAVLFIVMTSSVCFGGCRTVIGFDQRKECVSSKLKAVCDLRPNANPSMNTSLNFKGKVKLVQKLNRACEPCGYLRIRLLAFGVPEPKKYGFTIHEKGVDSNVCEDFGPHYNLFGADHGNLTSNVSLLHRHVENLGNVARNSNGRMYARIRTKAASLSGESSVIDRGIVLHALTDDFGTGDDESGRTTGNTGDRFACCTIRRFTKAGRS